MQQGVSVRGFISGSRDQGHSRAASPLCHSCLSRLAARALRVCSCCHLLSAVGKARCGRRQQPRPFSSWGTLSPHGGKIKAKMLVSRSENPIVKACVYRPAIILKQLHLNCNQTTQGPAVPCPAPLKGPVVPLVQ